MLKKLIRPFVPKKIREKIALMDRADPSFERHCPVCDYYGYFVRFGDPKRNDALCPNCRSLERHRLFWKWFISNKKDLKEPVIHFAPERAMEEAFRKTWDDYKTADLFNQADIKLNIEDIEISSGTINTIICNHVLEHVDDKKALSELYRILTDNGRLVVSVPIVEGWYETYENPQITDPLLRHLHFGQSDHVRIYGRDFRDRLRNAGFSKIEEVIATGEDVVKHGLSRGDKFFICSKN